MTINQLDDKQKVAYVDFKWEQYHTDDMEIFFYRFRFYNKKNKLLGVLQNLTDIQV